ncbi:hypothetical protein ACFLWR_06750 [Chloroflexota bacterium]
MLRNQAAMYNMEKCHKQEPIVPGLRLGSVLIRGIIYVYERN